MLAETELKDYAKNVYSSTMEATYKDVTAKITAAETELRDFQAKIYSTHLRGSTPTGTAKIAAEGEAKTYADRIVGTRLSGVDHDLVAALSAAMHCWSSTPAKTGTRTSAPITPN